MRDWYNVKDIEITKKFYLEDLGFSLGSEIKEAGIVFIKTPVPNALIGIATSKKVTPSTSSLVFDVKNIDEAITKLKSKGVKFIGDVETIPGMVKLATFTDPDGHSLMLAQPING